MNKAITISILISTMLCSTNVFARDWYEKFCTATQKDRDGNYYVGGAYNKYHMHVGSDFIAMFSKNNNSKPVAGGQANCDVLDQAIRDVAGGGYASPGDVTTCLNAARNNYSCP
ncbi:MAG: hypothetical protein IH605_07940 [Burkholderiales bacterium]|nr:hypothetical protein [Burkholderiales bacterium]